MDWGQKLGYNGAKGRGFMEFNEKIHAFIAARYYVRLTETLGDRGRAAFIQATQTYAEQRGKRMAKRAIRDGQELTFANYLRYGEWVPSRELTEAGQSNRSEVVSWSPDYSIRIHRCPWHLQFLEMGLTGAGEEYCRHLDNSICRGFNPYLTYLVPQTLHRCGYCVQTVPGADLDPAGDYGKKPEYLRSWTYHCAHLYWSFAHTARTVFGEPGSAAARGVLEDLSGAYGPDMQDRLAVYRDTDWTDINAK